MADNSAFTTLTPSNTSSAGLGDDEFRSIKSQMLAFWQEEHYLLDGSASSAGEHKPGSARAYTGTVSQLSNPEIGRLFIASGDTTIYGAFSGTTWTRLASIVDITSVNTWTARQTFAGGFVVGENNISSKGSVAAEVPSSSNLPAFFAGNSSRGATIRSRNDGSGYVRMDLDYTLDGGSTNTIWMTLDSRGTVSIPNFTLEAQSGTSFSSLKVGNGATIDAIVTATKAISTITIDGGESSFVTVPLSGVTLSDVVTGIGVNLGTGAARFHTQISGHVNPVGADEIVVVFSNNTTGANTVIPAQTLKVVVMKF